ncbi:MAG: hypothetical protein R3Y24_03945 [Eubacteriales bacterium]
MNAEEKKEKVEQAKKRIETANKFRLAFLLIAVVILALMYFGDKILEGVIWYENISGYALYFVGWILIFMLIATFTKLFLTIRYNQMIKK